MCGIFGAIGQSKNPQVSFDLLNSLFLKTEPRGTDASGFYATFPGTGEDAGVIFDKEPKKSSEYIKECAHWNKVFKSNPDVNAFIGHCRATSVNVGSEKFNKNNHPHLSDDRTVAMVHNGKVPEYTALRGKYDMNSDCDSEILLRMFESARVISKGREKELKEEFPTLTPFLAERLLGLKEIFSRVNYGAMAVAIAERGDDGQRYLWLFRDDERPLHVVDMRKTLGQIFFCSTADIWRNAIDATPSVKPFIPQDQVIIEFPPLQIWLLNFDPNKSEMVDLKDEAGNVTGAAPEFGAACWNIRKFKISKTKYIDWKQEDDEDDKLSFKKAKDAAPTKPPMKTLHRLDDKQEPVKGKVVTATLVDDDAPLELVDDDASQEGPPPLPPVKVENNGTGNGKKKVNGSGGSDSCGGVNTALARVPVSAQVKVGGRQPGDESEHDESPDSPILKNAQPVGTEEEINLDDFDKTLEQIEKNFAKIKEEVHRRAKEKSISGRDFSQVIDGLEVVRAEQTAIIGNLTGK